jgi:glycosyltransferase involved in cell wall biosynthesis
VKVLFDHSNPFLLAHGGFQIQIEQTKKALERVGVEVEYLRWWDANQSGDVIHFFGRPSVSYIERAHAKNIKVVMAELLGGLGARSATSRLLQRTMILSARSILPASYLSKLAWDAYRLVDACIALTAHQARLMKEMFDGRPEKIYIVPNGVETVFSNSPSVAREKWLLCTATITERKRVLELGQAAINAQIPLRVIGSPYFERDPYYRKFAELARSQPDLLQYEGGIQDREQLATAYRKARGFVLLSTMESLSLSALEAAACECPLLLSDLPWARTTFGENASYCSVKASTAETARALRAFYDSAPSLPLPEKPKTWEEIARDLQRIYDLVCNTSR